MSTLQDSFRLAFARSIRSGEHFVMYLAHLLFYLEHQLLPLYWLWPSGLRPTIEGLGALVGSLGYVKSHCSSMPATTRFLPPKNVLALHGHFDHGTQGGLMAMLGLSGPGTEWVKARLARCPKCLEEDIADDGLPFWRRDHLVPGNLFCGYHSEPLCTPCDQCADFSKYQKYTRHAGFTCGCSLQPIPEAAALPDHIADLEIEMSRIGSRLLDESYLPHLNHGGIGNVVAARAVELGIVEGGFYRADRAAEVVQASRFGPLLERKGMVVARTQSYADLFKGKMVPRTPSATIALLAGLHPKWEDVEHAFEHKPTEVEKVQLVTRSLETRLAQRERKANWKQKNAEKYFTFYAKHYAKELKKNPDASHVELMRKLPHSAGFFITEESLAAAGYQVPNFHTSDSYYKRLDTSFSQHVKAKANGFVDAGWKHRITRHALTRGHRMSTNYRHLLPHLPRTRDAIERLQETTTAWKQRVAAFNEQASMQAATGITYSRATVATDPPFAPTRKPAGSAPKPTQQASQSKRPNPVLPTLNS